MNDFTSKDKLHTVQTYMKKYPNNIPIGFDWKVYLELNPDVRAYGFTTEKLAMEHYDRWGRKENRLYSYEDVSESNIEIEPIDIIGQNENGHPEPYVQKSTNKKITIIIPNKVGQTPITTIKSLYKQTFKNFDIIIINDFDGNANRARNMGLRSVTTPYVLFSDNDINWAPTAIEDLYRCLEDNPDVSLSYGSYEMGGKTISNVDWDPKQLKKLNYISTMSMVRTKDHPGFDENIKRLQDWDVWLTMMENGKKGKYIGKTIFSTKVRQGITYSSIPIHEAVSVIKQKHMNKKNDVKFDIIIPSWNMSEYAINCLSTIKQHSKNYRIIFVDNASTNEEFDKINVVLKTMPHILIKNDENLGFVKAVNMGIKASTADYVIIMNNDTEAVENWLEKLVEPLIENNNVGASGPLTTTPNSWQGVYPKDKTGYVIREKGMLAFFCTMFKKEIFKKIGLLDESFGVGFGDDDDYCKRILDGGYRLSLVQDLIIPHHHRSTFKKIYSDNEIKNMQDNAMTTYKTKHRL